MFALAHPKRKAVDDSSNRSAARKITELSNRKNGHNERNAANQTKLNLTLAGVRDIQLSTIPMHTVKSLVKRL